MLALGGLLPPHASPSNAAGCLSVCACVMFMGSFDRGGSVNQVGVGDALGHGRGRQKARRVQKVAREVCVADELEPTRRCFQGSGAGIDRIGLNLWMEI